MKKNFSVNWKHPWNKHDLLHTQPLKKVCSEFCLHMPSHRTFIKSFEPRKKNRTMNNKYQKSLTLSPSLVRCVSLTSKWNARCCVIYWVVVFGEQHESCVSSMPLKCMPCVIHMLTVFFFSNSKWKRARAQENMI